MKINVYIDSCAWNYLFDHQIDLIDVFPRDTFTLSITREVEIELLAIPDKVDKQPLKTYINEGISACNVETTSTFGFASCEPDGTLSKIQVYGGFDQGTFQSDEDRDWYASDAVKQLLNDKANRKSGLSDNQADASLAVRSFDSIVLTGEKTTKPGPLKLAAIQGGKILSLYGFEKSGLSLQEYIAEVARVYC
jgi:hypothetical protein